MESPIKEFSTVHKEIYKTDQVPVLVYCDPGIDDAVMLGHILRNKKFNILGIICCAGNTSSDITLKNALRLCELANRTDIKVFRGSEKPIGAEHKKGLAVPDGKAVYGDSGLGGVKLTEPTMKAQNDNPIEYAAQVIQSFPVNITIISTGVLTDVYLTIAAVKKLGKEYLKKIDTISMMAGVFDIHNHSNVPFGAEKKWAEFNIYFDADASEKLFKLSEQNDIKIIMSALELTHSVRFSSKEINLLYALDDNPMAKLMGDLLSSVPEHYLRKFGRDNPSQPAHDLNASMCLLHPELYQGEWVSVECQDSDGDCPGLMTEKSNGRKNVFRLLMPQQRIPKFFENYAADLAVYMGAPKERGLSLTEQISSIFEESKKILDEVEILIRIEQDEYKNKIKQVFLDAQKILRDLMESSRELKGSSPSQLIIDYFVKNLDVAKNMFDSFSHTYLSKLDFKSDTVRQSVLAGINQFCVLLLKAKNQIVPPEKKDKGGAKSNDHLIRNQQCLLIPKAGMSSELSEIQREFHDLLDSINAFARRKGFNFPKVFVSYAWPVLNAKDESIYHEEWVQPFLLDYCKHLEASGITTFLDLKDSRMGFQTAEHMNRIPGCSHVILIGTQSLADKELAANCMVHTELNLIRDARKSGKPAVVPFLLSGEYDISFPKDFIRYTAIGTFRDQGYLTHIKSIIQYFYMGNQSSEEYEKLWRPFLEKYQHHFMPIKRKNNDVESSNQLPGQSYGAIQSMISEQPRSPKAPRPYATTPTPPPSGVTFNIKKATGKATVAHLVTVNHPGYNGAGNSSATSSVPDTVIFNLDDVGDEVTVAYRVDVNK